MNPGSTGNVRGEFTLKFVIPPGSTPLGTIEITVTEPSNWFAAAMPAKPPKFPAAIATGRFPTKIGEAWKLYFDDEKFPAPSPNNTVTDPAPVAAPALVTARSKLPSWSKSLTAIAVGSGPTVIVTPG